MDETDSSGNQETDMAFEDKTLTKEAGVHKRLETDVIRMLQELEFELGRRFASAGKVVLYFDTQAELCWDPCRKALTLCRNTEDEETELFVTRLQSESLLLDVAKAIPKLIVALEAEQSKNTKILEQAASILQETLSTFEAKK